MKATLFGRLLIALACLLGPGTATALVNFDEGQRTVKGIQLLQDASDPGAYYYLPQYPRLATKEDGSLELLCLKYVDANGGASGGLFHALVEFTLPPDVVEEVEKELKKTQAGARIVGPVPLMQAVDNGEEGQGSFQIVSAILSDRAAGGFTRSLISSGKAPLIPGSRAVVAALLNQQGATLLWDSLTGPTSDVSVAIHAYYEAAVKGYNARVSAEVSSVYEHFSRISNVQKGYTKRQLRKVMDDLQRNGTLKIEVLDRTAGLGLKASDMEGILQVVTDKLTELMFDHTSGWAADPPRETAVEANQIQGRQERGWFSRVFGGAQDTKYFTDDQFVLKKRTDIRRNVFNVTLSKSSTIKVPVDTAGNLGGLYKAMADDPRYFRVVNLADPAFEFRQVHFQVDGEYIDAFQDTINFVSVNVRKRYPDKPDFTRSLRFSHADVKAGRTVQEVAFPRLGESGADWTEYEYQVRWSVRDGPTLAVPAREEQWLKSKDAAVSLTPPFEKRVVEIDADRSLFGQAGMATAVVEFATALGNKNRLQRKATLRAGDAQTTSLVALYHDRDTPIGYRASWFSPSRTVKGGLLLLDTDYLFLVPPEAAQP
ncbi:MAG: hypothetical protein PHS77_00695 [Gallionellaceae bacterium]|nr:hypothetical protein [Gallionellaceae bacterium]